MATSEQITHVRRNTNELEDDVYSDEEINYLVDSNGGSVEVASAIIWEEKAARYSTAADVTEAGASHKFSDLFKNAQALAKYWRDKSAGEEADEDISGRPRVKKIVRS